MDVDEINTFNEIHSQEQGTGLILVLRAYMVGRTEAAAVASDVIRTIFSLPNTFTNEGVPGNFQTLRKNRLLNFYHLLFPQNDSNSHMNLLFFRAPPYSGKTGFAQLFFQLLCEDSKRSVVFLRCNDLIENESVASLFLKKVGCSLGEFLDRKEERVVILDEGQCSYSDESFWCNVIKNTLGNSYGGLRFVVMTSFGSFNPYRTSIRDGTPIEVPPENTFGLLGDVGLKLVLEEFEEMIEGSMFEESKEIIWALCSDHIGIASSLFRYLQDSFHAIRPTQGEVQSALYSIRLLNDLVNRRGMPSLFSFNKIIKAYKLENEVSIVQKMKETMDRIAVGEKLTSKGGAISPGTLDVVALLIKYGFLFEDKLGFLYFASQMHLKVWLNSNRMDILESIGSCTFEEFIVLAIKRMHSSRLVKFNEQNNNDGVRERQIQMELYSSIVSLLPRNVYVTPEWRTSNKKGYVDLVVVQKDKSLWFLELLVDGIDAKEHSERFEDGGKYHGSLTSNSKYAVIDFRQRVRPNQKRLKPNFLYVCFPTSFSNATIKTPGREDCEVYLLP